MFLSFCLSFHRLWWICFAPWIKKEPFVTDWFSFYAYFPLTKKKSLSIHLLHSERIIIKKLTELKHRNEDNPPSLVKQMPRLLCNDENVALIKLMHLTIGNATYALHCINIACCKLKREVRENCVYCDPALQN